MTHTDTPTGWPPGTIARYLGIAGATTDIRETTTPGNATITVTCTGCPNTGDTYPIRTTHGAPERPGYTRTRALNEAQKQAQDHAATCRALPRPGGA